MTRKGSHGCRIGTHGKSTESEQVVCGLEPRRYLGKGWPEMRLERENGRAGRALRAKELAEGGWSFERGRGGTRRLWRAREEERVAECGKESGDVDRSVEGGYGVGDER
eukprot:1485203-Rhodomonas_salina.1